MSLLLLLAGLLANVIATPQVVTSTLTGAPSSTSSAANLGPTIDLNNCCNSSLDATAWSLVYGLPLVQFVSQAKLVFREANGTNVIDTQAELASVASAAVVKPNVDTLYSRVIIDLSQNDLVLTVPNITDRFWIFPFYDVFGNNFANINPINGSAPGQYLIRRADDALVQPGIQFTNTVTADCIPKYQGIVNYPTTYGTMLIRLLVLTNSTQDLDIIHGYQKAYNISSTPRTLSQPDSLQAPKLTLDLLNGTLSQPAQLLSLLARIAPYNQPEILSERYRAASILGQAGLVNGRYYAPLGVNITQSYAIANATITAIVTDSDNINYVGNGWQQSIPALAGNFGTNYASRTYIAQTGYQQLVPYITQYPGWNGPSFRSYTLAPNTSFLFTFSGKPLIGPLGFWSITVYGGDQYLIKNTVNRYEIGDRSYQIKYDNGSFVYGPNATNSTTSQGQFKVLMQPADVPPPSNWTSNWLPAPPGGGDLSFILRWYQPSLAMTNHTYVYPKVETIPVIRA